MNHSTGKPDPMVARLLARLAAGEPKAAEELLPLVYQELRELAGARIAALAPGQTLQATALVHEAYLRMVRSDDPGWEGRAHFFGTAARAMREVLIDKAREKGSRKRGAGWNRVSSDQWTALSSEGPAEEFLDLDAALRELESEEPRKAEVVMLRFFGGLGMAEIAQVLGVSVPTVERDWHYARAWLRRAMGSDTPAEGR